MNKQFSLPPEKVWIDHTSIVHTDVQTLYALLSDVDNWPTWTPGLRSIRRFNKGFAAPGSFFLMTLDAPIIQRLVLPNIVFRNDSSRIEWGGGFLGSRIRHFMELTEIDENTTRLRHVEYATGLLALVTLPASKFAHRHDMRWSITIEKMFGLKGGNTAT